MIIKSMVIDGCDCLKKAYLRTKVPDKATPPSAEQEALAEDGIRIGKLGRECFSPYADMSAYIPGTDRPDIHEMIRRTQAAMSADTPVICEATFATDDLLCSVDVLVKQQNGWGIIEVKKAASIKNNILSFIYLF